MLITQKKRQLFLGVILWLVLLSMILLIPILPLATDKRVNVDFLEHNTSKNALVFFGFKGCGDVCPTTLALLRSLILAEQDEAKWPKVYFIDIDKTSNSIIAASFAKHFHHSFIGIHPTADELARLSKEFALNIKQSGNLIMHQGKTFLLENRQQSWWLVKTYNPKTFTEDSLKDALF